VADVFDYLGGGMTVAEVLDDFPTSPLTTFRRAWRSPQTATAA